jgi:hypothetical protein
MGRRVIGFLGRVESESRACQTVQPDKSGYYERAINHRFHVWHGNSSLVSMAVIMSDPSREKSAYRDRRQSSNLVLGTAAVYVGAGILLIAACEDFGGGLPGLPRIWYVNRTLWIGLGFLLIPAGIALQAWGTPAPERWKPSRPGRRFQQIRVYSKEGCHLCDEAAELLWDARYQDYLPLAEIVDISTDPDLEAKHGLQIPVVEFDGRIRFRGRIDEVLLRRLIEGTEPRN